MDSSILIQNGGLFIVALLVYSTTGLFFCFFLPSGALLFTAGMLAATGSLPYGLTTLTGVLSIAAFAGNLTGYLIGQQIGPVAPSAGSYRLQAPGILSAAVLFYVRGFRISLQVLLR